MRTRGGRTSAGEYAPLMLALPRERVTAMTPSELGVHLLHDLIASAAWSEWNYLNEAERGRYRGEAAAAIAGAFGWLRGQGLIGNDPKNGSSWSAFVVTPAGRRTAAATSAAGS